MSSFSLFLGDVNSIMSEHTNMLYIYIIGTQIAELHDPTVWALINFGATIWRSQQYSCISAVEIGASVFVTGIGLWQQLLALLLNDFQKYTKVRTGFGLCIVSEFTN